MSDQAPLVRSQRATVDPVAQAAAVATEIAEADLDGTVTAVTYTPNADITGAADDNRTLTLVNKGQDGTGTTAIATIAFDDGTDATRGDELAIPLSETPADLVVATSDILEWQSAAVGAGIADPGGLVQVELSRG